MKIAFVFDDSLDKADGIQQYMASLADYYTAQGHEVHYLVGETKRADIPNMHSLSRNIKVQFNGNRMTIPLMASKKRIRQVLSAEQFDVLHVQVPYHPLMAGRIIRLAGPKTAVFGTFHVAPYSPFVVFATRLLGLWSRPSLKRFNKMVSVSPAAADLARRTFKLETDIVPNVFDYNRFHDAKPFEKYDDEVKTIVFLGRLVPRKGCMLLLQAVAQLKNQKMRVIICGAGPLENALKTFIQQQKLEDTVNFVGRVSEEDKPSYLASADIAVFPSNAGESFGIVLIEAMASGRSAVLGGDNPGYRSVLGGREQLLFNPANVTELAQKLQALLSDDQKRRTLAAWCAEESAQYDVRRVGAELIGLYTALL